jgi:transposase
MAARQTIIDLFKLGQRQSEIAKALKISRQLVSKTILRYQELGTAEDRSRSGRPRYLAAF